MDDLVSFAQKMMESSIQHFNSEEELSSKVGPTRVLAVLSLHILLAHGAEGVT